MRVLLRDLHEHAEWRLAHLASWMMMRMKRRKEDLRAEDGTE